MFIVKFALELCVISVLFLMLRKALFRTFPIINSEDLSAESREWRGERRMFSAIFLVLGVILSIASFWMTYLLFGLLHSIGSYEGVMVISQGALIVPSLIFGFYGSTVFTRSVYIHLFGMNEYIFFDSLNQPSPKAKVVRKVFSFFTLLPAIVLICLQFNVYLKTDGKKIYSKQMLESEKIYSISEITRYAVENDNDLSIYLNNGERISTIGYSGNINYFLDNLTK